MTDKRSDQLSKLWPEFFSNQTEDSPNQTFKAMTEQQLRERAEAILKKHTETIFTYQEFDSWKTMLTNFALDFHKQELQRIGEVYQAVSIKKLDGLVDGASYPVISVRADKVTWFEMAILRDGEFKTRNPLSGL